MKNKKVLLICLGIFLLIIIGLIIFQKNNIFGFNFLNKNQKEMEAAPVLNDNNIEYTIRARKDDKVEVTIRINDEDGIQSIECPQIEDNSAINLQNINGQKTVSKDYFNVTLNQSYTFRVTTVSGEVKDKILRVNMPSALYITGTNYGEDNWIITQRGNKLLNLESYVDNAQNFQEIYIPSGEYELKPIINRPGYSVSGYCDKNKPLYLIGNNQNTIIKFYGDSNSSLRDATMVSIQNDNSVVRNLVYEYYPNRYSNYSKAIFDWCRGTFENVFVRVRGNVSASYLYYNDDTASNCVRIKNCTFFHDRGSVEGNYSGHCILTNIADNINANSSANFTRTSFGTSTNTTLELINNSKNNTNFINTHAGVFFGEYAWE